VQFRAGGSGAVAKVCSGQGLNLQALVGQRILSWLTPPARDSVPRSIALRCAMLHISGTPFLVQSVVQSPASRSPAMSLRLFCLLLGLAWLATVVIVLSWCAMAKRRDAEMEDILGRERQR
jgi:hypothetical protein